MANGKEVFVFLYNTAREVMATKKLKCSFHEILSFVSKYWGNRDEFLKEDNKFAIYSNEKNERAKFKAQILKLLLSMP